MITSNIQSVTYTQGKLFSDVANKRNSDFTDIIQKMGKMDSFQKSETVVDNSYDGKSDNKNISKSSHIVKGQPINIEDATPSEAGDYKIQYTDDGYLDIRSKSSGEGFRWKLDSNKIQVDSETGLKFLINDLGSGFFNMLPVDTEMEEALKKSLGVEKLEMSDLKGFTVHQDEKTGIHFITANGFEGQGGQIVIDNNARDKLDSLAMEYLRQYPSLLKDKNEAWFYATFEVRGMAQRAPDGIMMIGPNSLSYRNGNGEARWTSTFDNTSWSKIKSLFNENANHKSSEEWMFWSDVFMNNKINAKLILPDKTES